VAEALEMFTGFLRAARLSKAHALAAGTEKTAMIHDNDSVFRDCGVRRKSEQPMTGRKGCAAREGAIDRDRQRGSRAEVADTRGQVVARSPG
jgi:hypothetical protein